MVPRPLASVIPGPMRPTPAQLRRINLEGDAVSGSQDSDLTSLTRDHLHMSDDNGLRVATPAPALPPREDTTANAHQTMPAASLVALEIFGLATAQPHASRAQCRRVDPSQQGLQPGSASDATTSAQGFGTQSSLLGNNFVRARAAARRSTVAAPTPVDVPPPPAPPASSPFRDGYYWCTKCSNRGFRSVPGLMNHMTRTHAGDDESTRALLVAVERVTCIDSTCCGFRRSGARTCNRCNQTTSTRPPAVGEIMLGPAALSWVRKPLTPARPLPPPALTRLTWIPSTTCRTGLSRGASSDAYASCRPTRCCIYRRVADSACSASLCSVGSGWPLAHLCTITGGRAIQAPACLRYGGDRRR